MVDSVLTLFRPQNGHQQMRNVAMDGGNYMLDSPQVAKQMAALTAASQQRMAHVRMPASSMALGGTNSGPFLGPINNTEHPNFQANFAPDSTMAQPGRPQHPHGAVHHPRQRQMHFLRTLAEVMAKRGAPLPPTLTGVQAPGYDPEHSMWSIIEPSAEVGSFRLAGKDVDLFKLYALVAGAGGSQAVRVSYSPVFACRS